MAFDKVAYALRLLRDGYSLEQCAVRAGYASGAEVMAAAEGRLLEQVQLRASKALQLASARSRLDALWRVAYRQAKAGEPGAVLAAVKVLERQAKLEGLDAPVKSEVKLSDFERMSDDELSLKAAELKQRWTVSS